MQLLLFQIIINSEFFPPTPSPHKKMMMFQIHAAHALFVVTSLNNFAQQKPTLQIVKNKRSWFTQK